MAGGAAPSAAFDPGPPRKTLNQAGTNRNPAVRCTQCKKRSGPNASLARAEEQRPAVDVHAPRDAFSHRGAVALLAGPGLRGPLGNGGE
ncbi:hypothetical protein SKAU_G00358160 [Synaphobranchus kaupii]|uniref:Uncharacterized protein n=1 Tax=Synaphobranchus kaupii TaxID=118154 RepID=A0A9Q1IFU0_SYNKA|nr:hypothetical protein SKAU_G00358160 [Synaphobranchus kaupii]